MELWVLMTILALLGVVGLAGTAFASEASQPTGVAVTIYNENLALIKEERDFALESGLQTVTVSDVSGELNPSTVHLSFADQEPFELVEQNFDYDLVSQSKLLEKFIGRTITIIDDEHNASEDVTLLSTADGLVARDAQGKILLNPPGRKVLPPGAADELLLKPTLSWQLWCERAAQRHGEISYLSGGLSWRSDYVVMLSTDDNRGGIEGWVTINNYSGTTFHNAKLKLVAGEVNQVRPMAKQVMMLSEGAVRGGAPQGFQEEEFFEYHLYDLQRPTTLRNRQVKQIGLLTGVNVPFSKIYSFDGIRGGDIRVQVEFKNDEQSGMGMPLPAGIVRVFKQDSQGSAQFVGEDRIDHTPKDEKVKLHLGNAFDVVGESVKMDYKDLGKGLEAEYTVTLKNHKEREDVIVTVGVDVRGDWKVLSSNFDYVKQSASRIEFQIPVKANGQTELTFRYRMVWK